MKTVFQIGVWLVLILSWVACAPPPAPTALPQPTETPQPVATPTPEPMSPTEVSQWQPGQLMIALMDVRHGDAQLIVSPTGESLLIDAGEEDYAPKIAEKIRAVLGKLEVDYFLASHYHIDHIGAFVPLLRDQGLVVRKAVLDRGSGRTAYDSATYRRYFDYVSDPSRGLKRVQLSTGDKIDLGPALQLTALSVGDSDARTNCGISVKGKNDNDYSIVLWLTFGAFDYWTGGDLSGTDTLEYTNVESACAKLVPRPADLFKADHHAISANNNASLLQALQPQVTLISLDGIGNTDALLRIVKYGAVFTTNRIIAMGEDKKTPLIIADSDDIIVLSRDGSEFTIEGTIFKSR
ncbi:MAG: MBL fold metallo-hydrolase [Anaerolineales bacterium]|nr:MBL fold metallo-hydrolase [Anaerolineales bacterium]